MPSLLIVDDEVRILTALTRTLRREGYEIITTESPHRALEILRSRSVDLILSDQKMPGMSGIDLLASAAALRPGVIRMLITGWAESIPPDELRDVDVRALIPKPWDDGELKTLLREHLDA